MRIHRNLDPAAKRELERDRARRLQEYQRKRIAKQNKKAKQSERGK